MKPHWAQLIASGVKTLEIRGYRTKHRGPLLIAATRPAGVAVCIVDVVGCRRFEPKDAELAGIAWIPDRWAWELANVRRVEAFPVRGMPGIFDVSLPDGIRSTTDRAG